MTASSSDFLVTSSRTTSSLFFVSFLRAWSWVTMVMSQPFTWKEGRNLVWNKKNQIPKVKVITALLLRYTVPSCGSTIPKEKLHFTKYLHYFVSHLQAGQVCWAFRWYPGHINALWKQRTHHFIFLPQLESRSGLKWVVQNNTEYPWRPLPSILPVWQYRRRIPGGKHQVLKV